jgi:hypothetical protein
MYQGQHNVYGPKRIQSNFGICDYLNAIYSFLHFPKTNANHASNITTIKLGGASCV